MALTLEAFQSGFCLEHVDEAEFLLQLRRKAMRLSTFDPDDMARLDRRLSAHLQGLLLRPVQAWTVLDEAMRSRSNGELVALAGIVALNTGERERIERYLEDCARMPAVERNVRDVVRWVAPRARMAFVAEAETWRPDVGLELLAECTLADGHLATWLPWLLQRARETDVWTFAKALESASEPSADAALMALLKEETPLREAALSALLGTDRHRALAVRAWECPGQGTAQRLYLRAGLHTVPEQLPGRIDSLWRGGHRAAALDCCAASGAVALLPWLVEIVADRFWGARAGLAFMAITGFELAELDATEGEEQEEAAAPASEVGSPQGHAVVRDEEALLAPVPDPDDAQRWWREGMAMAAEGRLPPRLFDGIDVDAKTLARVLSQGFQYQRWIGAEIARAEGWSSLCLDPEAPFFLQRQRIKTFAPGR